MRIRQRTALQGFTGPFLGSRARVEGLVTDTQLRSGLVVRLFRDVYLPAAIPVTHELRCRAAALIAPGEAMLTGCSALAVRGLELVSPYEPVEILVPEFLRFTPRRGLDIRQRVVCVDEQEPWRGIRLATPVRAIVDMLTNTTLRKSLPSAVALLDAVLRAGIMGQRELEAELATRHDHGIVRARRIVELADPRAESIPESEVRVLLVLSGLHPVPQLNVYAGARFLGRVDLAFEEARLAVEYDGEWHEDGDQPRQDAQRRARLEAAGWTIIVVTRRWLRDDPRGIVRAVWDALPRGWSAAA